MDFNSLKKQLSYRNFLYFDGETANMSLEAPETKRNYVRTLQEAADYISGMEPVLGTHRAEIELMTGFHPVGYVGGTNVVIQNRQNPHLLFCIPSWNYVVLTMDQRLEDQELGILISHQTYSVSPILAPSTIFDEVKEVAMQQYTAENRPSVGSFIVFASKPDVEHVYLGTYGENVVYWDTHNKRCSLAEWAKHSIRAGTQECIALNERAVEDIVESAAYYSNRYNNRSTAEEIAVQPQVMLSETILDTLFTITNQFVLSPVNIVSFRNNSYYASKMKLFHRKDGKYTVTFMDKRQVFDSTREIQQWYEPLLSQLTSPDVPGRNHLLFSIN